MLVGPSGVGKGTIVKELLRIRPDAWLSISATTRPPRNGETNGVDYFFLTRSEFEAMIARNEFLEWAEYAGNYYGTPTKPVQDQLVAGKLVVLEIEVAGARQVKQQLPDAIDVMVLPPSMTELAARLVGRGTESETDREQRLRLAEAELAAAREFRFSITNDTVQGAIEQLLPLLPAQAD